MKFMITLLKKKKKKCSQSGQHSLSIKHRDYSQWTPNPQDVPPACLKATENTTEV